MNTHIYSQLDLEVLDQYSIVSSWLEHYDHRSALYEAACVLSIKTTLLHAIKHSTSAIFIPI